MPWPGDVPPPDAVAAKASYVGSAEHKNHPSAAGPPKLRHNDASPCDPKYAIPLEPPFALPTTALRASIQARRTSDFVGAFPKYVWGELDGKLYEARLVNQELGTYKAYPLSNETELPEDPEGLLQAITWQY